MPNSVLSANEKQLKSPSDVTINPRAAWAGGCVSARHCHRSRVIRRWSHDPGWAPKRTHTHAHTEWCEKTVLHSGTQGLLSPSLQLSLRSPSDAPHWQKWTAGGLQMVSAGITSDTWVVSTSLGLAWWMQRSRDTYLSAIFLFCPPQKLWSLTVTVRSKMNIGTLTWVDCWTSNQV